MEVREKIKKRKYLAGLKGRVQNSLSGFFRACIVAILVAFQFAIILLLPYFLRQYSTRCLHNESECFYNIYI